ncbi:hypothetical protein MMC32_000072 [Xylographa parallela]|nr:hypothetical protein [Xylographa parallela]
MKLIVAGASGFVATEIIRQCLSIPKITSVIALARRPVSAPSDLGQHADISKLHSVVLDNYGSYPENVKKQFGDAIACIWTVAITPSKSRSFEFDEVRRVCQEHTLAGLQAMLEAYGEGDDTPQPFRFMYISGTAAERDQTKTPSFMPQYCLMRGETESQILALATEHKGTVEACVAKPGLILGPGQYLRMVGATIMKYAMSVPNLTVEEISAAMLDEIINGFQKETLENDDLVRIGRQALAKAKDCNGYNYNYNCNNSAFSSYGRWILLAAIIAAALVFFLVFSCLSARRRKRQGLQPYRMTGWAHQGQTNTTQSQYQPPVQPYGNNNPNYYNNNAGTPNNAPPTYEPPKEGNYYGNTGANQGYFGGQQSGVELQQPNSSYQPRGAENVYSAPEGPPPAKGDGIIR